MLFRNTLIVLLLALLAGGLYYFNTNTEPQMTAAEQLKSVKKSFTKEQLVEFAFQQEFDKTRDLSTNVVPSERLKIARDVAAQKLSSSRFAPIPGITWEERGPNNVGGRTRAIMYDLNDAPNYNTVFAGGVGGGLWRTTDINAANPNWTPINDFWENIAISAIAQDPANPNDIYVGTGEAWLNLDAQRGNGIWKSTDGGATFNQLPSTDNANFYYINKIVVSNGAILAAIRSGSFANGGIYRSTDGGASWTRTLSSGGGGSIASDIEVAANGDLYAGMGLAYTDGIYKSTDNGQNWTKVFDSDAGTNEQRIELATAPSDANVVYALFEADGVPPIRKTTNGGATWTDMTTPQWYDQNCSSLSADWTRTQDWYDLIAIVDPTDANDVYIGGVDLFKSTDGANNWTQISHWYQSNGCGYPANRVVHADQHSMAVNPGDNGEVLFGHDGGVSLSTNADAANPANMTFASKSGNYNVTQFYACATSNEAGGNRFLAGAQDNGSHRYLSTGMNSTTEVTGGDGAFCHIDQDNPNIQITSYVYNNYYITTNAWGGGTQSANLGNTGRFINPTDYDSDANILYGAEAANTYSYIRNVGSGNNTGTTTVGTFGGTVSAVMVSPNTANRVFFGVSGGNVVRVDNANTNSPTATLIGGTGSGFPGGYVSCVAVERGDDDHLLVTFSNYGANSVWETTNGGTSWTSVEGDLPDMPVRWAEFNPNNSDQAIIGTELGVWTTDNLNGGSTSWGPSNANLANTRIDMLQFRPSDNLLLAATHGRGLFTTEHFQVIPGVNLTCSTLGNLNVTGTQIDITGVVVTNTDAQNMTAGTNIGFYLSTNATITTADLFLGSDAVPALASGASSTHNFSVDASTLGLPAGTYFIGYLIDYQGNTPESDENDNACSWNAPTVTIDCSATKSDCFGNTSFNDSTVSQNDNYNNYGGVGWGNGYTGPEDVYEFTMPGGSVTFTLSGLSADLDLLLHTDCDPTSTYLGGSFAAGTANETVTATLATGTYYLFVDGWQGDASNYTLTVECAGVSVRPKVFLQGPLSGVTMTDALRGAGMVPSNEPYSSGYNECFSSTVLSATGNDAVTDWVMVELRDATDPTIIVARRSALVQRDGDVVDVDGVSAVKFVGIAAGNYYVAVKHHNHLSVMTANTVTLN